MDGGYISEEAISSHRSAANKPYVMDSIQSRNIVDMSARNRKREEFFAQLRKDRLRIERRKKSSNVHDLSNEALLQAYIKIEKQLKESQKINE